MDKTRKGIPINIGVLLFYKGDRDSLFLLAAMTGVFLGRPSGLINQAAADPREA
jgi:hypothetical protein